MRMFFEYISVLNTDTSATYVEFYSLLNCFYFKILRYIQQKIYLFLWRPAISIFKCPKNSSLQGTAGF